MVLFLATRERHFFTLSLGRSAPQVAKSGGELLFLGSVPGDHTITLQAEQAMNSVWKSGLPSRLIETTTKKPCPHAEHLNVAEITILLRITVPASP
jgi:hypothetical protein